MVGYGGNIVLVGSSIQYGINFGVTLIELPYNTMMGEGG